MKKLDGEPLISDLASEFAKSAGVALQDLARLLERLELRLDDLDKKIDNAIRTIGSLPSVQDVVRDTMRGELDKRRP